MPVDAHEISIGYKYSFTNWRRIGALSPFSLIHQQYCNLIFLALNMFFEAKDVLIKIFFKRKKVILPVNSYLNVLYIRVHDKIFFHGEKSIVSTLNTSELIFRAPKKFRVYNKPNIFCSVKRVFGFLDKIVQNHDSSKIVLLPFPKSFGLVFLRPQSKNHFLVHIHRS